MHNLLPPLLNYEIYTCTLYFILSLCRSTTAVTHGYRTRRMAVEHSVPLITDVKCAKLMIKVQWTSLDSQLLVWILCGLLYFIAEVQYKLYNICFVSIV